MQNNPSILIVGNGPSASYQAAGKLAKGCEVARISWFFLEKKQIFGKQVDYLFHNAWNPLISYIYFVLNKNDSVYHIVNNIAICPKNVLIRTKYVLKNQMSKIDIYIYMHFVKFLFLSCTVALLLRQQAWLCLNIFYNRVIKPFILLV